MSAQLVQSRLKTVHRSGQISIGKEMGGLHARVDKFSDGRVLITPVKVVSTHDDEPFTTDMAQQLDKFNALEDSHTPKRLSVTELKRNVNKHKAAAARRGKAKP